MKYDLVLYGDKVLIDGQLQAATICVKGDKIEKIFLGMAEQLKGQMKFVEKENIVMPGLIDPHVHINEPGRTEWEGFDTATQAAAASGITTLVDMPLNSRPVTTSVANFEKKQQASEGKRHVNVGFWGGLVPDNADKIEDLLKAGVLGIKAFLTHSGIDEFPNITKEGLHKAMPVIAQHGVPLLVHCELDAPHDDLALLDENPQSYQAYLQSRPKVWEDDAISLMLSLCKQYNCPTHIVHLSSAQMLSEIKRTKKQGLPLTVETGQHYLYFDAEDIPDAKTAYKCAPPIREKANNEKLWKALESGLIDFVATDHSPAPPAIKELESGDFKKAWGGIAGLQFALPVLWTKAKARDINVLKIYEWLSKNPAHFLNLQNRKGAIAEGFDADFFVWNPERSFVVKEENILHRHKVSPYLGETLFGVVAQTYVGGNLVFVDGGFVGLGLGAILLKPYK